VKPSRADHDKSGLVSEDPQPRRLEPEDDPPARRLLLIRHGHYDRVGNLGDEVWGLSALGRRQAARTGRRLARLINHFPGKLEGMYASPWPRALQTAEIAAHEMDLGRIRVKDYLHETIPLVPRQADGSSIHPSLPPTTAEDRAEVTAQVQRVMSRFFRGGSKSATYLLFTHGNLIRYLLAETLGLPYESWMRIAIFHASITEIRVFPGNVSALISFNETGHLPPEMISA
jgi:broad specificity phosphatase PhoE